MKNTTISLLVAVVTAQSWAQDSLQVSYKSVLKSSYVGGQTGMRLHDGPVTQNSATFARKGMYAYIWVCSPLDTRWNSDYGSEIDLGFGHDFALKNGWRVDVGYAYYNVIPLENMRGDLHAISAHVYQTRGVIRSFARLEQDVAQNPSILPGGFTYKLGVNWSASPELRAELALLGHGRVYGISAETVSAGTCSLTLNRKLNGLSVQAGITFQRALGRSVANGGAAHNETVLWIGFSF
ncbi:hypothetical protein A3A71_00800 [Candidatus Berkelbacteria bacterium RIFCSPLOWO2_01_FULL_50_28]|uniref:Outer membrane protein beta-barrel domain-containing protein n=1 Tax=Candidatus Berkelbacteria bacterium RIFCSPLOWO2_01_FULL_50_28 TaxID=1797471 RepID=A0A1F5EBA7_9BACT|nr:MAG: hypothetical protein A2807_01370 [Candidatus Berkelbacteria bacterium RIFCSPHIGHO2_01_FULL_50_36]OGD62880.1 MAG: hypothetical protein A3F39_03915 [Candidatus Berkelbacteria bacterium RIFCSPHIGHO2_12_FULL_50_11]OGD64580.1 MAG: hypothetical protein A3A71_00800 [Candidatus Berkelbacteria bacterium RIFCSPLOWO2_01_FULL_50_28]